MIYPRNDAASMGITGTSNAISSHMITVNTVISAYMAYPMSIDTEMLRYQGRVLTYMYRNLQPATVLGLKGSDMSMSYSLKLNRYPLVLKKVKTSASMDMVRAQMEGITPVSPSFPYPMQVSMQYDMSIIYNKATPIVFPIILPFFFLSLPYL